MLKVANLRLLQNSENSLDTSVNLYRNVVTIRQIAALSVLKKITK